jgi:hypothetical protein
VKLKTAVRSARSIELLRTPHVSRRGVDVHDEGELAVLEVVGQVGGDVPAMLFGLAYGKIVVSSRSAVASAPTNTGSSHGENS